MNYLLDTCVFAEFTNPRPNPLVTRWNDAQRAESLFLSVLTVGEIRKGIAKLPVSKRKKALADFLENLLHRFDRQIISLDTEIFLAWGDLTGRLETKGRKLPLMDSLLAATALVNDLVVVTRNVNDFAQTGVEVLNIWDA